MRLYRDIVRKSFVNYPVRRFWIGSVLTAPVFMLEMGAHLFNLHQPGQTEPSQK